MTAPREIVPGRYWMVTRRCAQRQFLLRPDELTNQLFSYCLALAAERSGVKIIGFLAMSNHYHAVVLDELGKLPVFLEHLNKLTARALNARWGRWENLWAAEPACATHLVNPNDVFDKLLYVLSNPVLDHLVDRVHDWPGANSYSSMLSGQAISIPRPRTFFRKNGPSPAFAKLELIRPPGFESYSNQAWEALLSSKLGEIETRVRTDRLKRGTKLLGRKAVLRASSSDSPSTSAPRRNLRPSVACLDPTSRMRVLLALMQFRRAHEKARLKLQAGKLETVFPYGTYRMRLQGHPCAGPLQV